MVKNIFFLLLLLISCSYAKAEIQWDWAVGDSNCGTYPLHGPGWVVVELIKIGHCDGYPNDAYASSQCAPYLFWRDPDSPLIGYSTSPNRPTQCLYNKRTWHVEIPNEAPPLTCPATPTKLNPVVVGTGAKIQREDDVPSLGVGQVGFSRFFNNANSNIGGSWYHPYQKSLSISDPSILKNLKYKGDEYATSNDACITGWANLKSHVTESWAVGTTAVVSGNTCQIMKNGVIVRNLPIQDNFLPNKFVTTNSVQLVREDGNLISFYLNGIWTATDGDKGKLERFGAEPQQWRYTTQEGAIEEYSVDGKLINIIASNGVRQNLTYDVTSGLLSQVQDSTGKKLTFVYTNNLLTSVTTDDNKTTGYTYNTLGLITDVKRPDNTHRLYHYEDARFPTYLTGITDERGVRFATWTYDAQGRAITSQHAGGAEFGSLTYNADGSTTLTDTLGKQTIYRFDDIAGARRVTSVEGQPSTNCVGANKNYTYTPEGWIASKTDWNGNKITYIYNTKGQEVSRTEAFGSSVAKTITTEWHAILNLKTKVTEPDKETTYSYDANGLLLNQNVRSLP